MPPSTRTLSVPVTPNLPAGGSNACLLTPALFCTGFFMRPVGGLVLGYIGDRKGRKTAMTLGMALMALSVAMLATGRPPIAFGTSIFGLLLVLVWRAVCGARAHAVTFVHYMIQKYERGEQIDQPYTSFRQFQQDRTFNGSNVLSDPDFNALARSKTRRRMDTEVPYMFGVAWIVVIIASLI